MSACRVALADDAPDVRTLLRTVLEEKGFAVVGEARNGVEAVEIAEAEQPDVILLDLSMPVMDGLEAMPKIKEVAPRCAVVVLSGFVNNEVRSKVLEMGAAACLEKGIRLDDLISSIGDVCRGREPDDASTSQAAGQPVDARTDADPGSPAPPPGPPTPPPPRRERPPSAGVEPLRQDSSSGPSPRVTTPTATRAGPPDATFLDERDLLPALLHELNPAIAVLERSLDELQRALEADEVVAARGQLRAAQRSAQALGSISTSFVELQRAEEGSIGLVTQSFDLGDHVREVVEELAPLADEHVVRLTIDSPTPVVADRDRIRQVVANLLTNAVRFSPRGSAVDVTVTADGERAVLTVADEGPGIPAELSDTIFEKYARAANGVGGLGLGLYIARQIARAHGGDVSIDPGAAVGARVVLSLPV